MTENPAFSLAAPASANLREQVKNAPKFFPVPCGTHTSHGGRSGLQPSCLWCCTELGSTGASRVRWVPMHRSLQGDVPASLGACP